MVRRCEAKKKKSTTSYLQFSESENGTRSAATTTQWEEISKLINQHYTRGTWGIARTSQTERAGAVGLITITGGKRRCSQDLKSQFTQGPGPRL